MLCNTHNRAKGNGYSILTNNNSPLRFSAAGMLCSLKLPAPFSIFFFHSFIYSFFFRTFAPEFI